MENALISFIYDAFDHSDQEKITQLFGRRWQEICNNDYDDPFYHYIAQYFGHETVVDYQPLNLLHSVKKTSKYYFFAQFFIMIHYLKFKQFDSSAKCANKILQNGTLDYFRPSIKQKIYESISRTFRHDEDDEDSPKPITPFELPYEIDGIFV